MLGISIGLGVGVTHGGPGAAGGGGGTVGIFDSFDRANSTTSMGNTDTGQAWVVLGADPFGITGNLAYKVSGSTRGFPHVVTPWSDCTIQFTQTVLTNGGLSFRLTDDNNLFMVGPDGGTYVLYRRDTADGYVAIGSGGTTAAGDVLSVILLGTSITVKQNGVTRIAVTDAFQSTAVRHGIADADLTGRSNDFSVVP